MTALPLTDALLPALLGCVIAALTPFLTARFLAWVYLGELPARGDERSRRLVPFRRAALLVGLAQVQLAWMIGVTRLGPALVDARGGAPSLALGAILAVLAFLAGGVARRIEEPPESRPSVTGTILHRLRLVPFVAGPVIVGIATTRLPLVHFDDGRAEPSFHFLALAFALCVVAVAYGGLLTSLSLRTLRRAPRALALRVRAAADREGIARVFALTLPTGDVRFVNAAALPWARTVVVTEAAAAHLSEEELDAVLAHEAAHLSETKTVGVVRLLAASLLLFAIMPGLAAAVGLGFDRTGIYFAALLLMAGLAFRYARRLARRMEERADAHAKDNVGGLALASALRTIAALSQRPLTAGGSRVHPGLWDRLTALGDDPGPRPAPLPRAQGFVLGLVLFAALLSLPLTMVAVTDVEPSAIHGMSLSAARVRLVVDPWDGEAMLALAWRAREDALLDLAESRAEAAGRMGADAQSYYLLWAELRAARGDCEAARESFERSLAAEAAAAFDEPFGDLALGNYTLPPTLVTDCEMDGALEE